MFPEKMLSEQVMLVEVAEVAEVLPHSILITLRVPATFLPMGVKGVIHKLPVHLALALPVPALVEAEVED